MAVDPSHSDPSSPRRSGFASLQLFGCVEDQIRCFLGRGGPEHWEAEDEGHRDECSLECRLWDGEERVTVGGALEDEAGSHLSLSGEPADLGEEEAVPASQGQMEDPSFEFLGGSGLRQEQNVLDRGVNRVVERNLNHARHWLADTDAVVCISRHGGHVVSQHQPLLLGCTCKDLWIFCPSESDVLSSDYIERGFSSNEPTKDPAVEVLVGEKT